MGNKSIGFIFFKFFLLVFILDMIVFGVTAITLLYAYSYEVIVPANYAEHAAEDAMPILAQAKEITDDMIPDMCEYIGFNRDGDVIYGNMPEEIRQAAWVSVKVPGYSYRGNFFSVVERENDYCVISYRLEPQFKDPNMREKIQHPEFMIIGIVLLIFALTVILASIRFGIVIKKRLNIILKVTEKIEKQDLAFEVEYTNIKEINSILHALDDMKKALNNSLKSQWEKEELRKKQISGLAHDLKTPLTIIRGNAELLYDMEPDEEQKECIDYIDESAQRMSEYIKALIDLNNAQKPMNPKFDVIDMVEFANNIDTVVKGICNAKAIQYSFENTTDVQTFSGDRQLLLRAIENIVSNASDYTDKGKKIDVLITKENENLIFSIADEGLGFTQEGLKYADTLFYMSDNSRNSKGHYGIGLYEVSNIAKLHNGKLMLENRQQGGAVVKLIISIV